MYPSGLFCSPLSLPSPLEGSLCWEALERIAVTSSTVKRNTVYYSSSACLPFRCWSPGPVQVRYLVKTGEELPERSFKQVAADDSSSSSSEPPAGGDASSA